MTTKTTPPLQLFSTMGLKNPFPSVFTATTAASRSEEAEEEDEITCSAAEQDLRRHNLHNRRNHRNHHHHHPLDELTVTGAPPTVHPPVRPLRAQQQQQQQQQQLHWATSSTSVTPGYVVSASSSSITSSSQWSEFTASSSTVVQQTSHQVSVSTSSSHQFQTIRSQQLQQQQQVSSSSSAITVVPDAQQYLDDLKLPTQELDLAAQLGKSSMGRKGSLGTRRPPTIRSRKSSHGSLYYEVVDEGASSHPQRHITNDESSSAVQSEQTPAIAFTHLVGSGSNNKIPPPRPPPPVFTYNNSYRPPLIASTTSSLLHQLPLPIASLSPSSSSSTASSSASSVCSESAAVSTSSLEFCRSFASTPPPLPANSPPPLPDPDQLLMEFGLLHAALPKRRAATIDRSDAVSTTETIAAASTTASEGGGGGGGGIRRRTIVTLGSSGSINVTLVTSSSQPDLLFRSSDFDPDSLRVERTAPAVPVTVSASNSRASAFNVRRTIEQRRAQQQHQQQQQQQVAKEEEEEEQVMPVAVAVRTPPSSTYLYGEMGSPASSFLGSNRTMSISMSFDDLDDTSMGSSNVTGAGGGDSVIRRDRSGARRPEAWYERRQSYGFEAADKLQSLLNTSGSSDAMQPSPSLAVSRSCDSLSSTVRSSTASSQIEKMIPPWIIRNPSPGSTTSSSFARLRQESVSPSEDEEQQQEQQQAVNNVEDEQADSEYEVNYNLEEDDEEDALKVQQATVVEQLYTSPTPSLQRSASESSRSSSAQHLLTETPAVEPVWLRDLKVRRSLRETRRRSSSPIQQSTHPAAAPSLTPTDNIVSSTTDEVAETVMATAPVWLKVKLRPTGVNLVDDDPASSSPTKTSYTPIFTVTNSGVRKEPSLTAASSSETTFKTTMAKFCKVNTNKEAAMEVHQGIDGEGAETAVLNHHKSIELMRMLEETPLVNVLGISEALASTDGSAYSENGGDCNWTECSSTIASVRNSNEDLTASAGGGGASSIGGSVRMVSTTAIKVKKVAFGADVKEESDRKRSRPRRIRSRSPETRLRQWQEKLEEFKSSNSSLHLQQSQAEQQHQPEALVLSDGGEEEAEFRTVASGLPVTLFGDTERLKAETGAGAATTTTATASAVTKCEPAIHQTSETFRSLLQARAPPYAVIHQQSSVTTPVSSESHKVTSSSTAVTTTSSRDGGTSIVNGIVNFDSSVERKIVILEETNSSYQPPPKSILKKRSMENLLMDMPVRQLAAVINSERPRINVTMTNQLKDPHPAMMEQQQQQQVMPWRIHLKHVEHPPLLHPSPPQPLSEVSPWKADLVAAPKKTTTSSTGGEPTAMKEQIPPIRTETQRNNKLTTTTPGVPTAAEIIRNLRNPQPQQPSAPSSQPSPPVVVMMVARCEVKESTFIQPAEEEGEEDTQFQQHEPINNAKVAVVAKDWGYHSLEQQQRPETGIQFKATTINNVIRQKQQQQTTTIIDESIARLNETIEEIRAVASPQPSVDPLITHKRSSFHETSLPRSFVSFTTTSSNSTVDANTKMGILPIVATTTRSQAKVVSNKRFSLGNEDLQPSPPTPPPPSQVDDSRQTYYQATTSVVTHHHQSTTGRFPLPPLPPPSPPPSSSVAETPAAVNADRLRRRSTGQCSLARSPFALRADVVRPPPPPSASAAPAPTVHQQAQLKADSSVRLGNSNNKTITSTTATNATKANVFEERSFVTASSDNDGQREPIGMGVHTVVHHQNDRPSVATASAAGVGTDGSPGEESESDIEEVKVGKLVSRFESTASLSSTGSDAVRIKDKIREMQSSGKLQSMTTLKSTTTQQQSSSSSSWSSSVMTTTSVVNSSSSRFEQQKSIELTSGMAEDKAALLVRKFFGNDSIIEPKKSRLAQTETIMERDETTSETVSLTEQVEEEEQEERKVFDLSPLPVRCDDSPSDRAMTMSASSSFGSLLDDDRSIRTASSATTLTGASILRYSSCSERSVRLSDIIDRPDPESSASSPSELSMSASAVYTPPPPTRLIPSSRSNSQAETRSTTSATSSTTTTTGSGSFRRNGSNNARAQRGTISSVKRAVAAKPPAIRPSATAAARTGNSSGGSSSTRTTRRANVVARATTALRTDQQQQPPQPPPRMGSSGSIRAASAAWAKSLRTSAPATTARASARHPAAAVVTKSSSQGESTAGFVKPSSAVATTGGSSRASSRLVTITSYSSRPGSTARPEEAVSGIKVTPIAVGSGHYKIRMDQRLQASRNAASKTASSGTKTSSTSQRPTTIASKRPSRVSQ